MHHTTPSAASSSAAAAAPGYASNLPDLASHGWLPWLRTQRRKGLQVYMSSQCGAGMLHPELYRSGSVALELGVTAGPQMTPETAVVKLMLCLAYPDLLLSQPIAGEL